MLRSTLRSRIQSEVEIRYKLEDSIVGGGEDFHPRGVRIFIIENSKYEVDLCFPIKNAAQFITFLFQSFLTSRKKAKHEDSLSLFILKSLPPQHTKFATQPPSKYNSEWNTPAPYKCIINFCSLGSFSFF